MVFYAFERTVCSFTMKSSTDSSVDYKVLKTIIPETVINVPNSLAVVSFSFKKIIPIIKANIIEVSLIAITTAIGALKNAHITREYAKKEANPPPKKIHFALPIIFEAVPGETNLQ